MPALSPNPCLIDLKETKFQNKTIEKKINIQTLTLRLREEVPIFFGNKNNKQQFPTKQMLMAIEYSLQFQCLDKAMIGMWSWWLP